MDSAQLIVIKVLDTGAAWMPRAALEAPLHSLPAGIRESKVRVGDGLSSGCATEENEKSSQLLARKMKMLKLRAVGPMTR